MEQFPLLYVHYPGLDKQATVPLHRDGKASRLNEPEDLPVDIIPHLLSGRKAKGARWMAVVHTVPLPLFVLSIRWMAFPQPGLATRYDKDMINPLLFDSLLLGVQHSFEPDHMAAVSVLASEKNQTHRHLWRVLWRSSHWALGHSFTLVLFACFILLLRSTLSLNIAEQVELAVGPLMIWLGIVAIRRNFVRPHQHAIGSQSTRMSRSFWVGMVHGLAGTGGACTVALTLAARDAPTAVWLIILQSVGIIVAMTIYGCLLAFSLHNVFSKWQATLRYINYAVGLFSIGIGLYTLLHDVLPA